MPVQAQVPPALAALHNFIMFHDPDDITSHLTNDQGQMTFDQEPGQHHESEFGNLADGAVQRAEKNRATAARDRIAGEMWDEYVRLTEGEGEE